MGQLMSDKIDIHDRALLLAWWGLLAFVLAAVVLLRGASYALEGMLSTDLFTLLVLAGRILSSSRVAAGSSHGLTHRNRSSRAA